MLSNLFQIEWGHLIASTAYSRFTLPSAYKIRYIPITVVVNNNNKNTLYDAHLPSVIVNIQLTFFERGSYVNEDFYWCTLGY